jgi:fluoride exporter
LVESEFSPVFYDRRARGLHTFSSFSLQTLALARDGEWLFAALNAIGSFVLCLFAVWLGDYLAVLLNQR